MPLDPQRVQAVFLSAVECHEPAARAAALDRECSTDLELRQRVEALLRAYDQPESLLDVPSVRPPDRALTAPLEADNDQSEGDGNGPAAGATFDYTPVPGGPTAAAPKPDNQAPPPLTEGPGTRIGPCKLLQKIGEGGMGAVYMADQEKPVRRRVALKIIKPGMDSEQVVARFEAERQALAMMDHQNIARVFDAGTTEAGRPYFVMELVQGVPITEYCDEARLTPRERLELFIAGLPGDPARAPEGDHPPRHQAVERPRDAATTASQCPR